MNGKEIQKRFHKGQALVIALLVSFVLITLGAIFVSVIARNIFSVQQTRERLSAQYFAQSGVDYVMNQLIYSEEGADWRPEPENSNDPDDPDFRWVRPYQTAELGNQGGPTGGFARIDLANGRALIRVSYTPPTPGDPNGIPSGRYIKIESIGRMGRVDPNDPTTLTPMERNERKEIVAFAQIGSVDYLRFVMNHQQRANPMDLGAQDIGLNVPASLILGNPDSNRNDIPFGLAPIRVNGNLRWNGNVLLNINQDRMMGERVEVSGDITHNDNTLVQLGTLNGTQPLFPSQDNTNFTTYNGVYRDGKPITARDGYPRSIAYLDPPRMDIVDPSTSQLRYRGATRDSGVWRQRSNGSWFNRGQFGYGRGVYINNPLDIQQESRSLVGGYSLRGDWVKPGGSRHWNGPFYEPPGAIIELFNATAGNTIRAQGFRITRNQTRPNDVWYDPRRGVAQWQLPGGQALNVKSLAFLFPEPNNIANPRWRMLNNEYTRDDTELDVPFNGLIFAEGNVRIRGVIPSNRQITIVTNGTAYIEGNILKGNERSALAIIAKDYVCVNTTQFLRRTLDSSSTADSVPQNTQSPFYFTAMPDSPMRLLFSFGVDPLGDPNDPESGYTGNFGGLRLLLRHASGGSGSFINLLVNPSVSNNPFYTFNLPGFPVTTYVLGRSTWQAYPNFERISFPLIPLPNGSNYAMSNVPGDENLLELRLQNTFNSNYRPPTDNQPYLFSAATIQPLDIKIQAAMFAQNGSFFVIPGYWFNTDPSDTRAALAARGSRPITVASPDFPFYGDPLGIKITLEGAIAENVTASLEDQSEWMRHWGWFPRTYGNSNLQVPDQHSRYTHQGNPDACYNLFMRYDPVFRDPYDRSIPNQPVPLRLAEFTDPANAHPGRLLPAVPRLPVCPKPVYVGELRP